MNNFFDNPAAFAPLFSDTVDVTGVRRIGTGTHYIEGSCKACVFENGFADPIADGEINSDVRTFSVQIRSEDWIDSERPGVSYRLTLANGVKCAVTRVDLSLDGTWCLSAREVRK